MSGSSDAAPRGGGHGGGSRGIPTARNVDHVSLVVPDLEQAVAFFRTVLGCDVLYRAGPFFDVDGDWMAHHYGVHPRSVLTVAMLRCGPVTNVELQRWDAPSEASAAPDDGDRSGLNGAARARQDAGDPTCAQHLAFFVEDLGAATDYLRAQPGVTVLNAPTLVTGEPNEGTRFVCFLTPWGLRMELVTRPAHLPYEAKTAARLYGPARAWREGADVGPGRTDPL